MAVDDAFAVLGLERSAKPMEVIAAYRKLAKLHHPDAGGDAVAFHKVHNAYREAWKLSQKPAQCAECKGSGMMARWRGFECLPTRCTECRGTGQIAK